jgi:hypothetical protein
VSDWTIALAGRAQALADALRESADYVGANHGAGL